MQNPQDHSQRPQPRKVGQPGDSETMSQLQWVQRLAYQLCTDRALADDVGQEVLLAGFGGAPEAAPARRAWLAAAIRNRLRMARRGGFRRRDHELRAAADQAVVRSDGEASPEGLLERFEVHRQVSDAVAGLREPYRSTLLKRYFEGLTPTAIAEGERIPIGTVKTRITRGLKELRGELESEFEGGKDGAAGWFAALAPLAQLHQARLLDSGFSKGDYAEETPLGDPASAAPLGSLGGNLWLGGGLAPLFAAGLALLVTAAVAVGILVRFTASDPAVISVVREAAAPTAPEDPPLASVSPDATRVGLQPADGSHAPMVEPARPRVSLTVHVVDLTGRPISGVDVLREPVDSPMAVEPMGRTDGGGTLYAQVPLAAARLVSSSPAEVVVIPGSVLGAGTVQVATLVVAPARVVEGLVLGPEGLPIEGAELVYRSAVDLRLLQERPLNRASRPSWRATTDGDGRFQFPEVPELPGSRLVVSHSRFGTFEVVIGDTGAVHERVVMRDAARGVRGRVLTAAGEPVAGAFVAAGTLAARTDGAGEFRMELAVGADVEVRAVAVGLGFGRWTGRVGAAEERVTIQLNAPARTLRARVTLPGGAPATGLRVSLLDRTDFGLVVDRFAGQQFTYCSAETMLAEDGQARAVDGEGMFEAATLMGRSYRLLLVDGTTLGSMVTAPLMGGERLHEIWFQPGEPVTVRGMVAGPDGEALGGAYVRASVRALPLVGGGTFGSTVQGPQVTTDEAGAFVFEALVPGELLHLSVFAGPHYESVSQPVGSAQGAADFRLSPVAPFYVRWTSEDGRGIDRFELRDPETGVPIGLSQVEQMGSFQLFQAELENGRSPVYRVRVGKHLLVAMRGDVEVLRTTIHIRNDGDTQVIDL